MMTMQQFIDQIEAEKAKQLPIVNEDKWRNKFHLMAPIGWINDPNGLCYFKGLYHVFYQYSPLDAKGGLKFWGHYTSPDMVNWTEHEVALSPDIAADVDGVYSGSALIHNDEMYLFYTGNVKYKGDYDYILTGREQNVIMVKSTDGFNFSEKKVLLTNEDYPKNMGLHVRDPKVWEEDGTFYMVLGARSVDDKGYVLLYQSTNLTDWELLSVPAGGLDDMGYMWECPDTFKLEGKDVFMFSPQGMDAKGFKYHNVYQSGYAIGSFDESKQVLALGEFDELDRGFDFYAPQTFKNHDGRIIMYGWAGVPDAVEHVNPTIEKGWQHCLTLPRELVLKGEKIYQVPVEELKAMRQTETVIENIALDEQPVFELFEDDTYELNLDFKETTAFEILFREDCNLSWKDGVFTLALGESGYGRDKRQVEISNLSNVRIYSDHSILEIYLNDGEEVFTSRIYNKELDKKLSLKGTGHVTLTKWEL